MSDSGSVFQWKDADVSFLMSAGAGMGSFTTWLCYVLYGRVGVMVWLASVTLASAHLLWKAWR